MSETPHYRRRALRFSGLVLLCLGSPLLVLGLWWPAPAVNLLWDWSNALGYFALVLAVLLFIYAGRPRANPPFSGRFFANIHRDFGYIALLLVLLHIGLMLYAEPLLLEHMKPTAPLHMLAGLVSAVLMLLLVVTSITPLRRRVWRNYQGFRVFHAWLSISAVLLLLVHIVGSAYYLNSLWKTLFLLGVVAVVLGLYLDQRFVHLRHDRSTQRLRNTSHYALYITVGSILVALLLSFAAVLWWQGSVP